MLEDDLEAHSEYFAIPIPAEGSDRAWEWQAPQALPVEAVHAEVVVVGHKGQQVHCRAPGCQGHLAGEALVQQLREAHVL